MFDSQLVGRLQQIAVTPDRGDLQGPAWRKELVRIANDGATAVMFREKRLPDALFFDEARRVQSYATEVGLAFILNERVPPSDFPAPALFKATGKSDDLPLLRASLPAHTPIAVSVRTLEDALVQSACGYDALFFGPIWDTPSKTGLIAPRGLTALGAVCRGVKVPVIAIGGIDRTREREAIQLGAKGCAAMRHWFPATRAQS